MRALVTGGAGLIGSHIVDRLLAAGKQVRILDNLDEQTHPQGRPPWIPADAEFVEGEVQDRDLLARCLAGVDEIYHQAAFGGFTAEISKYYDANATGTSCIFEVIANRGLDIRKVVAASSQAIYGEGLYRCPEHGVVQPGMRTLAQFRAQEWQPRCPRCGEALAPELTHEAAGWNGETPYAVSKLAEERTVIGMGKRLAIPTSALRYAVTFGPRQSVFNPYTGIVSIFSTLLLNGLRPTVFEDGRQTRDYIFVGDIADANLLVMADERADGEVFNVGRGVPVNVIELIDALAGAYELPAEHDIPGDFRPGDVRHLVHDAAKIRALGWAPKTSIEDGIREVVDWIRGMGDLQEYFSAALEGLRGQGVVMSAEGV
ncbi:MAG TPA: NAD-dependent epimerase/dehydratase family protein [Solirubrobacteraceae bacterium]|nr:NAD-dependent epimerase/dehydratase family protein [Solirubrobacteraceae bacterium]